MHSFQIGFWSEVLKQAFFVLVFSLSGSLSGSTIWAFHYLVLLFCVLNKIPHDRDKSDAKPTKTEMSEDE